MLKELHAPAYGISFDPYVNIDGDYTKKHMPRSFRDNERRWRDYEEVTQSRFAAWDGEAAPVMAPQADANAFPGCFPPLAH